MCNAYRHPMDCHCGFGPPYDDVKVKIVQLPDPKDRNPSRIADLDLKFPIRARFLSQIVKTERTEVTEPLVNTLQRMADRRFGKGHVRVEVKNLRKGSVTYGIALVALVAAYKFFKDYEALSKGVKMFCHDIVAISKTLRSVLTEAYAKVETRVRARSQRRSNVESSKGSVARSNIRP